MKTYHLSIPTLALLLIGQLTYAQTPSTTQNYVVETMVKVPDKKTPVSLSGLPVGQANRTIQYFDGLGRPLQTVSWQASPTGRDIVQVFEYDALGREAKKYLPYAEQTSGDGSYKPTGGWDANVAKTPSPYSVTVFEPSPLNRVQKQGFPGAAWQPAAGSSDDHTVRTAYGTNAANEVKLWSINAAGNGATSAYYQPGRLYKTTIRDENWKSADGNAGTTDEYKDLEGRVVLKRTWETSTKSLSTYYVYDDLGNLRYVLPPAVNENGQNIGSFDESQPVFDQFIYGYRYDGRRRLIEKKVPGKGKEEMVYNRLDQVVYSRDAVLAGNGRWLFNKYDAFGRTIITGLYGGYNSRAELQSTLDVQTVLWEGRSSTDPSGTGYTSSCQPVPFSIVEYYTISYFDDYAIPGIPYQPIGYSPMLKGLPTASRVKVLGSADQWLWTVQCYDDYGRVVRSWSQHHLGGTDITDNSYNFDGSLKGSTRSHSKGTSTTTIATVQNYDHVGRPTTTTHSINGAVPTTISENVYNEIGQLKQKKLHNGMQSTAYAYNERGWLRNSTSGEFSMQLKYEDGTLPQYNGNISGQVYTNGTSNSFGYSYDRLNRLLSATATGMAEQLGYDVMGNIASLNRDNTGAKTYNYSGNRLQLVTGLTGSYQYDANGNATTDGRTGTTLSYNHLNLPQTASRSGLSMSYTYDATGRKLRKVSTAGGTTTTDYVDGIQYVNGVIDFIQTPEGIALNSGGSYSYRYNLSDHLGNVRTTFDIYNGAVRILQRDDYYAFGLRKLGSPNDGRNKYLYNGKELQEELGQYDYGARFYDPVIARWNVVDPLQEDEYWSEFDDAYAQEMSSEGFEANINEGRMNAARAFRYIGLQNVITAGSSAVHYNSSPYAYVLNNPLSYIDPLGLDTGKVNQLKEVAIVGNRSENNNFLNSWWTRGAVYSGGLISAPLPKKWIGAFVAKNSSTKTTILSATLGKWKRPINFMGKRRLYTHTLNGSKRTASTWGKYLGRWGSKVLGRLALAYSLYDVFVNEKLGEDIALGAESYYNMQEKAYKGEVDKNGWPIPIVCFTRGTLIYSTTGLKPIEDIKTGDSVYCSNIETNKIELGRVSSTFNRKTQGFYEIKTANDTVCVTSEHPFYVVGKGWVKAKDLQSNYLLKSSDEKNTIRVITINYFDRDTIVYNLEVDNNHNYFVTGSKILVHNKNIKEIKEQNPEK